jgi:hypothetical protein
MGQLESLRGPNIAQPDQRKKKKEKKKENYAIVIHFDRDFSEL